MSCGWVVERVSSSCALSVRGYICEYVIAVPYSAGVCLNDSWEVGKCNWQSINAIMMPYMCAHVQ